MDRKIRRQFRFFTESLSQKAKLPFHYDCMLFGVSRFLNQESMDQSVSQSVRGTKINFKVPDLLSQFFIPDQVIKIVEVELQQELHLLGGFQHQEGWVKI